MVDRVYCRPCLGEHGDNIVQSPFALHMRLDFAAARLLIFLGQLRRREPEAFDAYKPSLLGRWARNRLDRVGSEVVGRGTYPFLLAVSEVRHGFGLSVPNLITAA
ncbi:hypothetical protein FJTKL_05255 [Diaporthe vaccinii]|uniref:Uncharacterized protein n=1 Tax=Diaporthe vaccinii TaxID=105482 RepID=A0ABR4FF55_9PEZI